MKRLASVLLLLPFACGGEASVEDTLQNIADDQAGIAEQACACYAELGLPSEADCLDEIGPGDAVATDITCVLDAIADYEGDFQAEYLDCVEARIDLIQGCIDDNLSDCTGTDATVACVDEVEDCDPPAELATALDACDADIFDF